MKKIAPALIMVMLFALIFSCGNDDTKNKNTRDYFEDTTTKPEIDYFPDARFNGETINIMEYPAMVLGSCEVYSEGEDANIVNDAIFRRNMYIEDRLNITINSVIRDHNVFISEAEKSIMSGEGIYDMFLAPIVWVRGLCSKNMLIDLNTLPYVDFEKPWWDQRATADLSIANKLFINVGAHNLSANFYTYLVIFNKALVNQYALEDPYQVVRNGKWTLDTMYSMMKAVNPRDLNGDGIMDEQDFYGLLSEYYNTGVLLLGSGEKLFRKDEDDLPYVSMNTPRAVNVLDKVFDISYNQSMTVQAEIYINKHGFSSYYSMVMPIFMENRSLFYVASVASIQNVKDMDNDFGLVPVPKYDEYQQEFYCTNTINGVFVQGVPVTNDKLEVTGAFLEAVAYESPKNVVPTYYETAVQIKLLRDEESIEMLELVARSRVFDLGYIYDWGGALGIYQNLTASGNRNFVSEYEKRENSIITAMEKSINEILGR